LDTSIKHLLLKRRIWIILAIFIFSILWINVTKDTWGPDMTNQDAIVIEGLLGIILALTFFLIQSLQAERTDKAILDRNALETRWKMYSIKLALDSLYYFDLFYKGFVEMIEETIPTRRAEYRVTTTEEGRERIWIRIDGKAEALGQFSGEIKRHTSQLERISGFMFGLIDPDLHEKLINYVREETAEDRDEYLDTLKDPTKWFDDSYPMSNYDNTLWILKQKLEKVNALRTGLEAEKARMAV
jgi:hypothetical protein